MIFKYKSIQLKCVTERQHWRIVKIIKECEREANAMMKIMKPPAHYKDSHVGKM